MIDKNFEHQLIQALQPLRYHALATAIYHLFNQGVYDKLVESAMPLKRLAEDMNLDEGKLLGFLRYLANEGIIEIGDEQEVRLSQDGLHLNEFRSWYIFFVGGYGSTFLQIGEKLKRHSGWAERDTRQVGIGSGGLSRVDAVPLARTLMSKIPGECNYILDVGCGNGLFLIELCKVLPNIKAWGVEADKGGYDAAVEMVRQAGLESRIFLNHVSALEFVESPFNYKPDIVIVSFLLQEVLSQEGEQGVVNFLNQVLERFPDISIVVIEVDQQIANKKIMLHSLSLAFYNPYYLLHYFTNQRLETPEFWERIFERCQLKVRAQGTADINVDSTGLVLGYVLKRRS